MSQDKRYWFPAKRFGWGWGIPGTWQGWLVLAAYLTLVFGSAVMVRTHQYGFTGADRLMAILGATVLLIAVCWWKGEPPSWHSRDQ